MDRFESGQPRHPLSEKMLALEHALLEMASRVESMLALAVESLVELDGDKAMEVLDRDDEIDELDLEIENRCLSLLALQHPTASDFRTVGTALKMITDIERIGDLSVDIAKAGMKIEKEMGSSTVVDVPRIALICRAMIRQSIEAFVRRDLELVREVVQQDDEVDRLYRDLREQIHEHMRSSPNSVVSDSWPLLAIHHVERIADHAVNIAERVSFMVTGRMEDLAKSHRSREFSE